MVAAIPNIKGIESVSQNKWLAPMYENELFRQMLIEKFKTEIQPKVNRLVEYQIDDYVKTIHRAVVLDALRWESNKNIGDFSEWDSYEHINEDTYKKYDILDSQVNSMKEFLIEKERFLEELWVEGATFEVIIEEKREPGMNLELNNDIYTWIRKD